MRMVTSDSLPPELLGALDALSLHPAVRPLALVLGPDRPGARDLVARLLAEDWEVVLAGPGATTLLERHAQMAAGGRLRSVPFDEPARLPALIAELEPDRCVDLRPLSPPGH
ncbi:MAG TPA: hypothetical protein PLP91_07920 [Plasticicumulans sp.]|uniref:hypothetical protein n=1 Tax=Plasticicumulans sp. TaxID=2307179 RepID=UPI002BF674E4|nr:hypothetical protein [Plasticicumulans sp.]MBS0600160.1 hypothetical protein [Pseudomonadota bacterium]HMW30244.1 hypothetical protein [Plasticicumulans sp.]HMW42089.1 hypothetical protein [Plasticicumulans sp.]HMZ09743.1 hypothetical protein [Plasticicumulans sp.]HNB90300.1 hypothetical protein [Plasticicumulans sp.]